MSKFFAEFFQDTDGGASSKRLAFFVFILFFIGLSLAVVFHGLSANVVGFAQSALEKAADIIKWLGAYILADKTPQALAAFKGGAPTPTSTTVTGG